MLKETKCDGVMIGRGALGNPFIFTAIVNTLSGKGVQEIEPVIRFETALKHIRLTIKMKNERIACRELRKHICAYTKGLPGAAPLRRRIVHASTFNEYQEIINDYLRNHAESAT
jgi:tRNA-dihydrouridine synthase